jgi:glycosyltransferase involved in cell wall biosynthesis
MNDQAGRRAATIDVDVVMPVRDVDRFLDEALASALGQRGVTCRVFIVDDASTRPVRPADSLMQTGRVALLRSEAHLGIGGARNLGCEAGSAAMLAFLDADDVWPAESVRALVASMKPTDAYASGRVEHFADASADAGMAIPPGAQHAVLPGSTMLRRKDYAAIGGFRPELRVGEFVDLMARGMASGWSGGRSESVVLRRRVHRDHASRRVTPTDLGYLKVVRDQLRRTGPGRT